MPELKDLDKSINSTISLAPAARSANTTVNGTGVDLAGFERTAVLFIVGTVTDGTHTPKLQESDDNSSFSDVAAGDQSGTLAALASTTTQEVGYLGAKRYIRAVLTTAGATTGAVSCAQVIRSGGRTLPA